MLQFEELRQGLLAQEPEIRNLYEAMDIEKKEKRLAELEAQSADHKFLERYRKFPESRPGDESSQECCPRF